MTDSVSFFLSERLDVTSVTGDDVERFGASDWREGSDWQKVDVAWQQPASVGEIRELRFAYEGVLFPSLSANPINSITGEWVELGLDAAWHPVFASFDQRLAGELTLRLPGEWTVVASGDTRREGEAVVIRNRVSQIDFAFIAAPTLKKHEREGATVYHQSANPRTVERVIDTATSCREWLRVRFGELPPLKFVLAPRDDSGYARKNYIVLAGVDDFSAPALSRFICHELAHYWSSPASPSTADYWMTEAFAEVVSARHVRDVHGDTAYEPIVAQWREQAEGLPPVWTDTSTARPGFAISYRKAPLVLTRFGAELGEPEFDAFLERFMTGSTRTTEELLGHLHAVAGAGARDRLKEMLAEGEHE